MYLPAYYKLIQALNVIQKVFKLPSKCCCLVLYLSDQSHAIIIVGEGRVPGVGVYVRTYVINVCCCATALASG